MQKITHSIPPQWTGVEYSSMSPFNSDTTRLLLIKVDHFGLWDGGGHFLHETAISSSAEPRWSRTEPTVLFYLSMNSLLRYDVNSGQSATLHVFSEYLSISGKSESEISPDGDHLVLCGTKPGGQEEVFVYQISTGKKFHVWPQTELFDGLKIDGHNRIILSKQSGLYVYDGSESRRTIVNGHACLTQAHGRDIILWCSASDPAINTPTGQLITANAVVAIDIETGVKDIIHVFDWKYSFHIAAPDGQPWCIVSTDCPDRSLPSQVWKVYLDKTKPAELLCGTGSIRPDNPNPSDPPPYNYQVKAAVSRDGSKIVGSSNFGDIVDPNYCDVFMLELSATASVTETRIDYSSYVGKSEFVMRPRSDGAIDIFERKLK